jgi:hypothetical protein
MATMILASLRSLKSSSEPMCTQAKRPHGFSMVAPERLLCSRLNECWRENVAELRLEVSREEEASELDCDQLAGVPPRMGIG